MTRDLAQWGIQIALNVISGTGTNAVILQSPLLEKRTYGCIITSPVSGELTFCCPWGDNKLTVNFKGHRGAATSSNLCCFLLYQWRRQLRKESTIKTKLVILTLPHLTWFIVAVFSKGILIYKDRVTQAAVAELHLFFKLVKRIEILKIISFFLFSTHFSCDLLQGWRWLQILRKPIAFKVCGHACPCNLNSNACPAVLNTDIEDGTLYQWRKPDIEGIIWFWEIHLLVFLPSIRWEDQ